MEEISLESQKEKIRQFNTGFKAIHLLNIGAKVGILQALKDFKDGITVSDLASKLKLHEPYVKIWCQTAYSLKFLDFDNEGRVKYEPFFDEILGDESSINSYLDFFALPIYITGERLKQFPDYFRTGEIMKEYTDERSELVAKAARILHRGIAQLYFPLLPEDDPIKSMLVKGINFLDIGCGRGGFIIQLAQLFKNNRFWGVDPVNYGIEAGKKEVAKLKMEDRIFFEHLSGEDLTYNNEFDIVSMVLTFHEILPDVRVAVVEKAFQALKQNGRILIIDFSFPEKTEDFRNPNYELGVIDQFDEICLGNVMLNMHEQNEILTKIGLKSIQRTSLQGFDIITAEK